MGFGQQRLNGVFFAREVLCHWLEFVASNWSKTFETMRMKTDDSVGSQGPKFENESCSFLLQIS